MGFFDDLNACSKANDYEIKRLKQRIKYTQNKQERERLQRELENVQNGRLFTELGGAVLGSLFK